MDELEFLAHPNDAYVKHALSDLGRATLFFQSHLDKEIVAQIDWSSIQLEPSSFVKQSLHQTHSDLLYTVRMGERDLKLYLLFEHQTTVDKEMPLRVLVYVLEIWQRHLKEHGHPLPPVLPFVLHQGPDRWSVSPCFEDLFGLSDLQREMLMPYLPKFRHALLDLTQHDPDKEELHDQLRLVLQLMKLARQKQIADFLIWIAAEMSRPDWKVDDALVRMSYFYAMCTDATIDGQQIAHSLRHQPKLKETIMSFAEQLIARGEARGKAEGKSEGVWIRKIQMLQQMLGKKVSSSEELDMLGVEELQSQFAALESEYSARFKNR